MTLLTAVDLRSATDVVYSQANSNVCTAKTLANALEAEMDHAGYNLRFSASWFWWHARAHTGRAGLNVGASFESLKYAVETFGAVLESEHPWNGSAFNPPPTGLVADTKILSFLRVQPSVDAIKRKLCLGIPVTIGISIYQDFYSLFGQKDWRKHRHDVTSAYTGSDHAVCIVGYDDAAGRFLVENSWGPSFGDGGFFGIPYEDLAKVCLEYWTIDRIEGFTPRKVEGFVSVPYLMDANDNAEQANKLKPQLKQLLQDRLAANDLQGFVDLCKKWHVSDKRVENYFSRERFWVQNFQRAYPQLNWADFPWTQA